MCADDAGHEGFEEMVRSIARELSRSVEERIAQVDVEDIAGAIGVDPTLARQWVDSTGRWLREQAENLADEVPFGSAEPAGSPVDEDPLGHAGPARSPVDEDPLGRAGPHPLDVPSAEQGQALAALDSGRWTVEPGSNALEAHGEGPGPSDALGLVRELRARDWIAADGEVTVVGRHALSRWLDAAMPR